MAAKIPRSFERETTSTQIDAKIYETLRQIDLTKATLNLSGKKRVRVPCPTSSA
jgi:ferritin-like metal-binding protein YciE